MSFCGKYVVLASPQDPRKSCTLPQQVRWGCLWYSVDLLVGSNIYFLLKQMNLNRTGLFIHVRMISYSLMNQEMFQSTG